MRENIVNEEIMSYKTLYRMVGILGMILPILDVWKSGEVPPSISDSYYLGAVVPFVLILGSLGLILFCNTGFGPLDAWCNRISGVAAVAVLSFPCKCDDRFFGVPYRIIHFTSATILFLTFAVMCLFVFTKIRSSRSATGGQKNANKRYRDLIYRVCGVLILVGMPIALKWTFWGEVWMLEAFGIAYLVQGKTIFKD